MVQLSQPITQPPAVFFPSKPRAGNSFERVQLESTRNSRGSLSTRAAEGWRGWIIPWKTHETFELLSRRSYRLTRLREEARMEKFSRHRPVDFALRPARSTLPMKLDRLDAFSSFNERRDIRGNAAIQRVR